MCEIPNIASLGLCFNKTHGPDNKADARVVSSTRTQQLWQGTADDLEPENQFRIIQPTAKDCQIRILPSNIFKAVDLARSLLQI